MQVIATSQGTHSPTLWANYILEDLVPLEPNARHDLILRVVQARERLRPAIEECIAAVRINEQQAWDKFTDDEKLIVIDSIRMHNSLPSEHSIPFNDLHKHVKNKKLRSTDDWLDQHVVKVCKAAMECEGDKPIVSEMQDRVVASLKRWYNSVLYAERSQHVTSRGLL